MVGARMAASLAVSALAASRPHKPECAVTTTLPVLGRACVIGGVVANLLLYAPAHTLAGPVIDRPHFAVCRGLPAGRPCLMRGGRSLMKQVALKEPAKHRGPIA